MMAYPKRTSSKSTALVVLKAVAKVISAMSQEDVEALESGKATLVLVRSEKPSRQSEMEMEYPESKMAVFSRLRDDLSAVETTDAGFAILRDARLTRSELERLTRALDLPVMKQDSVSHLEEKVVEALVGSRLNSRAVRGR